MEFCWMFQFLRVEVPRKLYSKCDVLCNLQTRKELTNLLRYLSCWKLKYLQLSVCPQCVSHWLNEFSHAQKYLNMLSFCFHSVDYVHAKSLFRLSASYGRIFLKRSYFATNPTKSQQFMKNSLLNEIIHYRKFLLRYSKWPNISSQRFISHLKTAYFHVVISSKLMWLRALEFGTTI